MSELNLFFKQTRSPRYKHTLFLLWTSCLLENCTTQVGKNRQNRTFWIGVGGWSHGYRHFLTEFYAVSTIFHRSDVFDFKQGKSQHLAKSYQQCLWDVCCWSLYQCLQTLQKCLHCKQGKRLVLYPLLIQRYWLSEAPDISRLTFM